MIETTDGNQSWFDHSHQQEKQLLPIMKKQKRPTHGIAANVLFKEIVILVALDANVTIVFVRPVSWYEDDHSNGSIEMRSFKANCFNVQRSSIYWNVGQQ